MTKTTLFTAAIIAMSATTAFAGYTIYQDDAFPSVMFVEIEGGPVEEPTVISAPSSVSADPALPVVTGGEDEGGSEAASAPAYDDDRPATDTTTGSEEASADEPTFEERVERNVVLGDSADRAVQRVINEEELDSMELR
ncbi:MAG: hypothetical protein AAFR71_03870 [Pseudomonadota bacterium]